MIRVHNLLQGLCEGLDTGQMLTSQALKPHSPHVSEREVYAAMIGSIPYTANQAGALRALGELHRTVMSYVQLLSSLSHCRPRRYWVAT